VRHARLRAERDDGGLRLGGERAALGSRLGVDERAGRCVDLLVAEGERRVAAGDEIELLVPVALVVLLDDALVALLRRVGVRPKGLDSELAANRPEQQAIVVDREAVEIVDVRDFVCLLAQVLLLRASRTTGSIFSTPSTRSSRFSFPVH
jgi:hypothetical protein